MKKVSTGRTMGTCFDFVLEDLSLICWAKTTTCQLSVLRGELVQLHEERWKYRRHKSMSFLWVFLVRPVVINLLLYRCHCGPHLSHRLVLCVVNSYAWRLEKWNFQKYGEHLWNVSKTSSITKIKLRLFVDLFPRLKPTNLWTTIFEPFFHERSTLENLFSLD